MAVAPLRNRGRWDPLGLGLGDERTEHLTTMLAGYAPESLGLQDAVVSLGEVGPRLGMLSLAAALIPATGYGTA